MEHSRKLLGVLLRLKYWQSRHGAKLSCSMRVLFVFMPSNCSSNTSTSLTIRFFFFTKPQVFCSRRGRHTRSRLLLNCFRTPQMHNVT